MIRPVTREDDLALHRLDVLVAEVGTDIVGYVVVGAALPLESCHFHIGRSGNAFLVANASVAAIVIR